MSIFGAQGVNKTAYVAFITEYKSIMYRIAFGYLGDETKALDAIDEAVYLGYVHRKELRETSFLKTWLTRILINECYRILRKMKREVTMDVLPEQGQSYSEGTLTIKMAVQVLPEDLRKVIVLRYFGGYTIADTAAILAIPEGTVATRTRNALKLLRVELSEQEGGE
ncbi:RNA polymerase sigma factor, sigma-70 family [Desulfitobacterium dichloroeliminans LMG P-21439]|uniref:RNA polymerase sigma factor, sigma-70 family n=1 Tax=Desulfitobacterium dichloroeliminans (strain LMG P-21439 / DCA1) TaxID=871963 RepID=L0F382_DESDL|nr:sigma-70 family RNA polymerase sigma factor [Desulfitobacterium dichloroeliminans]AGA67632.1 RNA polymerase sigma factor, sigma-70 family [Desulfitobacterium dichloroeliminans LMG P-21439]